MTTPEPDAVVAFADLELRSELLAALDELGYEEPTPIQREAIPPLLAGRDLLGQAATGTGKTAAFALPLLQHIAESEPREAAAGPLALVLVPTRELAMQVSQAVHRYGRSLGARVVPVYGGQPVWRQVKALERGVDVVVATPGRALDHLGRGTLALDAVEVVVLDEADEMLDMGFAEDLDAILDACPPQHQTMLFSATMPPRIDRLARQRLHEPVRIALSREQATAGGEGPLVRQSAYVVARNHKPAALGRVLDVENPTAAIVFCRTRTEVDELTETMNGRGYRAEALHGGMSQQQRDRVMDRLRSETAELLVATDVAARGLDIDHLTHVVNYDVPSSPEAYVHRIGRVGRAGREGVAITLVEPRQHRHLKAIEHHTGQRLEVEQVPTVADLRARRLELMRAALRETLVADPDALERFRPVVESLSDEFDLVEIALAAVALAQDADGGPDDEEELPDVRMRQDGGKPGKGGSGGAPKAPRAPSSGMTRLWISAGRNLGIRPKDLVGAIAGESSLTGRDVGDIQIAQKFSLVEVPDEAVDEVIAALRTSTVKGKKVAARRDQKPG